MRNYESLAMCWMVGWFVLLWPIYFAIDGNFIAGIINSIIGVLITIMILWFGEIWEDFNERS